MTDLTGQLNNLAALAGPVVLGWSVVFCRVAGVVALLPAYGEVTLPARLRLGIALAFTLIIAPVVAPAPIPLWPGFLLAEPLIGLMLGLGLRLFVFALQFAGTIIAQSISLAQMFGVSAEPQPVVSHVLTTAALALAVASGLHIKVAGLLIQSYDLFPLSGSIDPGDAAEWATGRAGHCFRLAVALAGPFVLVSFIYNLAIGIINRAMPQMMVSMIGAPALALGGMALLAITTPLLLSVWLSALDLFLADPLSGGR